jgi:hypothetical protein
MTTQTKDLMTQMRDDADRERRIAQATEAHLAAMASAAANSTALRDAQEIEGAHVERQKRAGQLIAGLVSLFEEQELEFMQEGIIRDLCFSAHRNSEWCQKKLKDEADYMERLATSRYAGSDTTDEKLARAVEITERVMFQREAWLDLLVAGQAVHRNLLGKEWMPPASSDQDRRKTHAASQAEELINRIRGNR